MAEYTGELATIAGGMIWLIVLLAYFLHRQCKALERIAQALEKHSD